jgi:tellurite resistance protein
MELFLIILGIIGFNIWRAVQGGKASVPPAPSPFEIRVRRQTDHFESLDIDVFVVEMRGGITAPRDNYSATAKLTVRDVTGGEDHPVFTALDSQQLHDSPVLGIEQRQTIPYCSSVINEWVIFCKIPIDLLTFPRKGARTLRFSLEMEGTSATATVTVAHECKTDGYLEAYENRQKFEELTLQLAFAVSAADGAPDRAESEVIKAWGKERVDYSPAGQREEAKERLNKTLREVVQQFNQGAASDIPSLCRKLKAVASVAERYDAIELCLHVAKADGVADRRELELLSRLSDLLEIDSSRFRELKDKILPVTMIKVSGQADVDQLLGIHSGMSAEEVKKHLRNEFQKWNRLATHSSPEKREQAGRMLEFIAKKRAELPQ